jgi:putative FmdB family regulatory protein
MSTYTFECENCNTFNYNMSYKDLPLKQCPHCGSVTIRRVFQPTNSKVPGGFGKSWEHSDK